MCGRLVITEPDLSVFVEPFHVQAVDVSNWIPRYNLAPTQLAPLITNESARRLTLARFGLVPSWAEGAKVGNKLINARVESVGTSKAFGRALRTRRGVVPATGYFEWQITQGGKKRPLFIHDRAHKPLALAALWDRWHGPDGEVFESFAVITRPASGFLEAIHSRMPFELRPADIERWLSPAASTPDELASVLGAAPDVAHLESRPVSALANSPKNDGPECIEEAQDTPEPEQRQRQLELFEIVAGGPARRQSGRGAR
jgi:putative SOS response-associated peptidase YedK